MMNVAIGEVYVLIIIYIGTICVTFIESCDITGGNCISKPENSTCVNYSTYFSYTDDVQYLLQLEYIAMNYIEANVSNQYCRNYLKAALCVTIYPPCNDSGVQNLCSEECDGLLNNGECSTNTRYLTEHVNSMLPNSFTDFTINCSKNSTSFLNRLSNKNPCQSSNCVSLLEIAEFPDSCTQIEFPIEESCSPYSLSLNHMIFKYTSDKNFSVLLDYLKSVDSLLRNSITKGCTVPTGIHLCNMVFIPCNLTTGTPRPLCPRSCFNFCSACNLEFNTISSIASIIDVPVIRNCENTLHHINTGYGYPNSSSDFEDDCYDLPDLPILDIESPTCSVDLPTKSTNGIIIDSSSNIITSTYNTKATSAHNTMKLFSTVASKDASSTTDKVAVDVTNSYVINTTEAVEHENTKPTIIPLILAVVFGGLLGLCIVVCIVALILRKKKKMPQIKQGRFSASNPLFKRISNKRTIDTTKVKERLFAMEILKKQCKDLLLPNCDIELITKLGEGEFGQVFKGTWVHMSSDGNTVSEVVAIKTIKNYSSMEVLESFLHESILMKNFDHPNVLHILGVGLDPENGLPFIVLPFMANGNLQLYLKSKRSNTTKVDKLPEGMGQSMLVDICHQIACGMNYLAIKRFIHRDLAARNCMVGNGLNIKVADFGLAKDVYMTDYYRQQSIEKMPVKWMAPEALHDRISNEKTDVWSYGVTCWEVFSLGRTPYPTVCNEELLQFIDEGNRLPKPELCNDDMYSLMLKCWKADAESRICFDEIVTELNEEVDKGYVIECLDDNDGQTDNCYTVL